MKTNQKIKENKSINKIIKNTIKWVGTLQRIKMNAQYKVILAFSLMIIKLLNMLIKLYWIINKKNQKKVIQIHKKDKELNNRIS